MSERAFRQLLDVAAQIADRAADSSGFVALHALAREVQAEVKFRPLLVEGLAAQPKSKDGRWLVLIDSETHGVLDEKFASEDVLHPLGARVRNTVAHELAHALGPRCEAVTDGSERSRQEIVSILERETEQLSPVLLIPSKAVESLLNKSTEPLNVEELVASRDSLGVSSRVFVKRLELLTQDSTGRLRYHPRLANVVIGSGEWLSSSRAELHPMPFRGMMDLVPQFVTILRAANKVPLAEHFPDPDFLLNGGSSSSTREKVWLGTNAQPRAEERTVELSVETTERKAGISFLWVAHQG